MRIHVIARDIRRHDAVGNFCRQIHAFLGTHGYDVSLAAENYHADDRFPINQLADIIPQITGDDIIIFHFSTEDPAFPVVAALDCPKVLYFHNITPERFFTGSDERTADLVRLGLGQRPCAASFDVLMANSQVTARVLYEGLAAADRKRIGESGIIDCPPLIGVDRWTTIEEEPTATDVNARTVLYVGRQAPHKGIRELVEGFALLAAGDDSVGLVCVGGSPDALENCALPASIAALEPPIAQRIKFVHDIPDGVLKSIYTRAGVCASMSRHEGFGVPLVDGLAFDKPLVINAEAGMMETAGEAAIVVDASDPEAVATALGAALNDKATRTRLASARRARLETLRHLADGHLILNAVNQARTLHRARIV
jgi:glycosyltransferase involved in cell wall biosynthesis